MSKEDLTEEKRKKFIKNKTTIGLSISLIAACVVAGVFGVLYIQTTTEYDRLSGEYNVLSLEYNILLNNYQILTGDYDTLFNDYDNLQDNYNALLSAYNSVCNTIKQSILPVQYCIFAEAVRRYYRDIYVGGLTGKAYWKGFAEFCRDIILHDSNQYNSFTIVSNAFSDALKYGSNTMYLAWNIMYWTFYDWLPYWGLDLTSNELWGIDTVVQWCIDEIDYEYDSDITDGQEYFDWDYIKFPVETAFRTMGDCEDQAILCSACLESCGFETAISIYHDPEHPTYGEFYHGVLLVHIEDTSSFLSNYPSCSLWCLGYGDPYYPDYTWCYLDPTWDVPFGSEPSWLDDYGGSISYDIHSTAFCDIDGNIQGNLGIECIMPI